jgi:hypothetical protein
MRYGMMKVLGSDRGSAFVGIIANQIFKILGVKRIKTSTHHPQSNGVVEIFNKTMKQSLKIWTGEYQQNWDELLAAAIFSYNTAFHSLMKETPYYLNHGCSPPTISDNITQTDFYNSGDVHAYALQLTKQLTDTHHRVREILEQVNENREADNEQQAVPSYKIGDQVLLFDPTTREGVSKKLVKRWQGPYTVIEKHSDVVYTIMKGEKQQKVNIERLRFFSENKDNSDSSSNQEELATREIQAISDEILALNKRKSEIQQQHSIISAEKCVEKLETEQAHNQLDISSVINTTVLSW